MLTRLERSSQPVFIRPGQARPGQVASCPSCRPDVFVLAVDLFSFAALLFSVLDIDIAEADADAAWEWHRGGFWSLLRKHQSG